MLWIYPEQQDFEDIVEYLLKQRGIEDTNSFLNPSEDQFHDPYLLYDSKKAAEAILDAVNSKKKIFIHGDFDVDGITATTIMWQFLYRDLGANALPYIPSRFSEGYGLSDDSIQAIIDQGGELIITVDCGIKDIEIVKKYKDKIDFVITDHHTLEQVDSVETLRDSHNESKQSQPENFSTSKAAPLEPKTYNLKTKYILPPALAVVHPKIVNPETGKSYPFAEICGANVSWKVCQAINKMANLGLNMNKYLDLVALGTTCDIMPLINENRSIVALGIKQMQKTKNIGLKTLFNIAGYDYKKAEAYHLGYVIGPRLNAAGRISHALDAVRLLSTESESKAIELSQQINNLNIERQNLTQKFIDIAEDQIQKSLNQKIYFVHGEEWPEGVVGLIAGKLTQKYNRPVLAASKNGEIIKGSARSIEEFNISSALHSLSKHLVKYGGHASAAGFTLNVNNLEAFLHNLNKLAQKSLTDDHLTPKLIIDALLQMHHLTIPNLQALQSLQPFGANNKEPIFAINRLKLMQTRELGRESNHLKMNLTDQKGKGIEVIGFNKAEQFKNAIKTGNLYDLAGNIEINEWNGNKKIQMKLVDMRESE